MGDFFTFCSDWTDGNFVDRDNNYDDNHISDNDIIIIIIVDDVDNNDDDNDGEWKRNVECSQFVVVVVVVARDDVSTRSCNAVWSCADSQCINECCAVDEQRRCGWHC